MANYDTKRQISEAYMRLLKTKGGDKITVKDLFTECDVSRQTFYYHFRDLMDVIEYTLHEILNQSVRECSAIEDPKAAIGFMLNTVMTNRFLIRKLENTSSHKEIERFVVSALHEAMAEILDNHDSDFRHLPKKDRELLLDFTAHGVHGLMLALLEERNLDVDHLADQLFRICSGQLKLL